MGQNVMQICQIWNIRSISSELHIGQAIRLTVKVISLSIKPIINLEY